VADCSAAQADPAGGWTLPRLTVVNRTISDVTGRAVLLRGVNDNELAEYAQNDPSLPTVAPFNTGDFARMASLGFNVVRLNLSWSLLEPTPGAFDRGYVNKIHEAVDAAKSNGIYTLLDMHQDAWGPAVGTPKGKFCPPVLTKPGLGWDGAPAWATITDGWSTCAVGGVREISPAVARAFQNFYDNTRGIQDHLVATWGKLAAEFKSEPAVMGYDLLNEPNPGVRNPISEADQLGRFYQRAIAAIRVAERGGSPHLMVFEPSAIWSAFGIDATPPARYVGDPLSVFSPHLYNESINVITKLPSIEQGFQIARSAANRYGVPMWTGEWGWFGNPNTDAAQVNRFIDQLDRYQTGGAWWSWTQACGDPHTIRDGNTQRTNGNLNLTDCPSGAPLGFQTGFTGPLSRAYPRAMPGRVTNMDAHGFNGVGTGRIEAWYPGAARPQLTATNVQDLQLTQVSGGWRLTAQASGAYAVMSA